MIWLIALITISSLAIFLYEDARIENLEKKVKILESKLGE